MQYHFELRHLLCHVTLATIEVRLHESKSYCKRANLIFKYENYDKLTTEGYCMKCKVRRDMRDEKRVRTKNGRSGISGVCTLCGGKMFKMVGGRAKATGKAKVPSKQRSIKVGKVKVKVKSKRK
ncbi:MAG: DUF5679 domain-containing protein [Candidatus Nitrosopolaris sp.]